MLKFASSSSISEHKSTLISLSKILVADFSLDILILEPLILVYFTGLLKFSLGDH